MVRASLLNCEVIGSIPITHPMQLDDEKGNRIYLSDDEHLKGIELDEYREKDVDGLVTIILAAVALTALVMWSLV